MTSVTARRLASASLVAAGLLAMGSAILFARADQAQRIAADAEQLGRIQASAAEAAIHRASLVIAFASVGDGFEPGPLTSQTADEAVGRAIAIANLINAADPPTPHLQLLAAKLVESTSRVRDLLGAGDVAASQALVENDTLPVVEELAANLTLAASEVVGRIEAEKAAAGGLARATSYLVALLVPALVAVGIRLNARRRTEKESLETEVVRQRELTEAKEQLIAGLSHQLRTPLTGIYGYADLLMSRPDPDIVREGTEAILSQSGDLRRMVEDILVTARLGTTNVTYRPTPTDVVKVVERAMSHYVRIGAHIKVDCDAALFPVDAGRLEHVIRNVIANAVNHGGDPIEISGRVEDQRYVLAVSDGGSGLDISRAANPFAPLADKPGDVTLRSSLGLGLSVARTLVEGMGGDIEYFRRNGQTVFTMSLPTAA
jgi:signal transduction histidine kinase